MLDDLIPSSRSFKKPFIMGIVNVTPDSFSDGGRYLKPDLAVQKARELIRQGANLIDIGGESSKPGACPISATEELDRVIPVLEQLRAETDTPISIDTYKPLVMIEAVCAGATMINDIFALRSEGALETAAKLDVPVCLMHMQGKPKTMQNHPRYDHSVIDEINYFFQERISACEQAGIQKERLILDPGFGFGKTVQHNLMLIKHFHAFRCHQLPLLLGVSRKSTLGVLLQKEVHERITGGIVMMLFAALQGMAIIRTHDVEETRQALEVMQALCEEETK
ncbi:dihydropteroate synthase [Legionella impletisoli]|uniref:Dihydropteroate synthase n=1 Tax=Legionella impletisoli TaxID=343510 RepID=A0A917JU35_9GAMM|nr:dihydropteroate synthase [Legionella impletisoli]GGI84274.1 dihydropteroate synthase [Legionella impletisoli]